MMRRGYRVSGRVQGVGFRWFVRETALGLGLRGYVLNRPDGDVEAVAEGTEEALAALEAALREGPPAARVEHVHSIPAMHGELPNPFALLHAPPSAGPET